MSYSFLILQNTAPGITDPVKIIFLILFWLLFLFISAVTCGGEQALFSLNEKDLNMLKAREDNNAKRIPVILEQPKLVWATLLICRIISNLFFIFILISLFNLLISAALFPALSVFVKVILIFFLLMLFCEILPRAYARQKKMRMVFFAAPLIHNLINLFEPLASAFLKASDGLSTHIFRRKSETIQVRDLDQAFAASINRSANAEEKNILRSLIQFESITVRQIMKARMDIHGIAYETSFSDLIQQVHKLLYSRLPVYNGNLDQITGIIHVKDLIEYLDEETFDWHSLIRTTIFVPEKKLIRDLLQKFQAEKRLFAVVVDEFGGTSGIVTMEDIMEEIVGDIRDEFDTEEPNYQQLEENTFIFEGKTMLNAVGRILELPTGFFNASKGNSDSLGGLILELSGNFPEVNQEIHFQHLELIPLEIRQMRIQKIKVIVNNVE